MAVTRLLVTGGRNFDDRELLNATLDAIHAETPVSVLIHGACLTGADLMAAQWAFRRQVHPEPFPADWENIDAPGAVIRFNKRGRPYNVKAGFARNAEMVRVGMPTIAVAFRGNNGTDDCVACIKRAIRGGAEIDFRDMRTARSEALQERRVFRV